MLNLSHQQRNHALYTVDNVRLKMKPLMSVIDGFVPAEMLKHSVWLYLTEDSLLPKSRAVKE